MDSETSTKCGTLLGKVGIYFAIVCTLPIILSCILYYISDPFPIMGIWVSNLGVGSSISAYLFNIGLCISGILFFVFSVLFSIWFIPHKQIDRWIVRIAQIFNILSVVGIFILTTHNMVSNLPVHSIGSYMFFIGAATYTTGIGLALNHNHQASLMHRIITIVLLVVFLSVTPIILLSVPPTDWPTVLGNMSSQLNLARLMEWIALGMFYIWLIYTIYQVKKLNNELKQRV